MGCAGNERDRKLLYDACQLAKQCPPSNSAFSVGAIIVDAGWNVLATGYSRESDPHDHAEESALSKLDSQGQRLVGATIYSSLEPCSSRASRQHSCTELILDTAISRVVFALREPMLFVDAVGAETLRSAGRTVLELSCHADLVRDVNAHLLA